MLLPRNQLGFPLGKPVDVIGITQRD